MTMSMPAVKGKIALQHADRYESLRRHGLRPSGTPAARDGLAVLLRQGMATWVEAWSRVPPPAPHVAHDERGGSPLPEETDAQVVRLLVAMALGHIEEVCT